MSMFSRTSFRPPSNNLPSARTLPEDHSSPFEEEDEYAFDLHDPKFQPSARSRSGSEIYLDRLRGPGPGESADHNEDRVEELQEEGRIEARTLSERLRARDSEAGEPTPRHPSSPHNPSSKMSYQSSSDSHYFTPQSAPTQRPSPSPVSRPHHLNALSPLQAFSPLSSSRNIHEGKSKSQVQHIETSPQRPGGGLSRNGSLTRSLSRRQSIVAGAARWGTGEREEWGDENDERMGLGGGGKGGGLFSRLTLVKAPAEKSGLKQRSQSSSSLAPFSTVSSLANTPATSSRGPRRSFAASSFAGFSKTTPLTLPSPYSPSGPDSLNRISHTHHDQDSDSTTQSIQRKHMTPEEVVEVARQLNSPVLLPEGGFKGSELKRRKSAGSGHRKLGLGMSMSSIDGGMSSPGRSPQAKSTGTSPEFLPPIALEPVEYIQMDEDTLLPFINRPSEVKDLLQHHSNEKMFKLLRAAFPKFEPRPNWKEYKPEEWSWLEFTNHLTEVERDELGDYEWVYKARSAVRARSVALWEKVGTCLGCDGDLLNVGGEDGGPVSWGGLGLGEEGEEVDGGEQVWIEGIEGVDEREREWERREREQGELEFREEFGDVVEDEGGLAGAGMTALLGGLVEGEGQGRVGSTAAQRAGRGNVADPMGSPSAQFRNLTGQQSNKSRSKSFVGLQICTSPNPKSPRSNHASHSRSPSSNFAMGMVMSPVEGEGGVPIFERGPGNPLFPSSFSGLSVEPNLGRSASVAIGRSAAGGVVGSGLGEHGLEGGVEGKVGKWGRGLVRKPSGAGLSESAITFASESDYAHSAAGGDHYDGQA